MLHVHMSHPVMDTLLSLHLIDPTISTRQRYDMNPNLHLDYLKVIIFTYKNLHEHQHEHVQLNYLDLVLDIH